MIDLKSVLDIKDKIVLVRCDLNIPFSHGKLLDDARIKILKPTVELLLKNNNKIILLSHFKNPTVPSPEYSLRQFVPYLEKEFGKTVVFLDQFIRPISEGDIYLFENLRFYPGEKKNEKSFAQQLASMGDVYVNEAFSASHRAHASIVRLPQLLPAFFGLHYQQEIKALDALRGTQRRPALFILGGAKLKTKIHTLPGILEQVDHVFIGGHAANTFLSASGIEIDHEDCVEEAKKYLSRVILPIDVRTDAAIKRVQDLRPGEHPYDVGPETEVMLDRLVQEHQTVIWNGAIGMVEDEKYAHGTNALAASLIKSRADVIIAGGDTMRFIPESRAQYRSTAGGAFLNYFAYGRLI